MEKEFNTMLTIAAQSNGGGPNKIIVEENSNRPIEAVFFCFFTFGTLPRATKST